MQESVRRVSLVQAVEDLKNRTLASFSSEMARLVYLSSTRDYLTGRYYHDGLAFRFQEQLAETALGFCHHELFERIINSPLSELVRELDVFFRSQQAKPREVLETWKKLQPYRMLVPQDSDSISKEFFFSNIRIGLEVLESRLEKALPPEQQAASLRQ